MDDRRGFLKRLGLGAAIVPNTLEGADRSAAAEIVRAPEFARPDAAGLTELTSDWLYSGLVIPKNSMRCHYYLFADSIGQAAPWGGGQIGLDVTNMCRPGHLPPPTIFGIDRVGVFLSPATEPRLRSVFTERAVLEFWIEDKIYFRAPLAAMFDVMEPERSVLTVSAAQLRGSIPLGLPVVIPMLVSFKATLSIAEPLPVHGKIKLWAYLAGRSSRAAQ